MVNRLPLLLALGALNAGLMGYYLFLYDDGMAPKWVNSTRARERKAGAGLSGPRPTTSAKPASDSSATPVTNTPEPGMIPEMPSSPPE